MLGYLGHIVGDVLALALIFRAVAAGIAKIDRLYLVPHQATFARSTMWRSRSS